MRNRLLGIAAAGALLAHGATAQDLSFEAISTRHATALLSDADRARMQAEGECLAGIKELNSLPPDEFQPNIEWLRIRTGALLTLARPCEVLVMLESAHNALRTAKAPQLTAAADD